MDPCIKDIVDHLKSLGYTFKKDFYENYGLYYFFIKPPGFPYEGLPVEKLNRYCLEEDKKVKDIIKPIFDTRKFWFQIVKPSVYLCPLENLSTDFEKTFNLT